MKNNVIAKIYWNLLKEMWAEIGVDIEADEDIRKALHSPDIDDEYFDAEALMGALQKYSKEQPTFGLELGKRLQIASHGYFGFALSASASVDQAIELLESHYQSRAMHFILTTEKTDAGLFIHMRERFDLGGLKLATMDTTVLTIYNALYFLLANHVSQCKVYFANPAPPWKELYPQYFQSEVIFDAEHTGIEVPQSLLTKTCALADKGLFLAAKAICDSQLAYVSSTQSLSQQIVGLLRSTQQYDPNHGDIAAHFHISTRTLNRKLAQEDTNLRTIIDNHRKQAAASLLSNSQASIEAIAHELDYSDLSNFSRSFKRWYGMTPGEFRSQKSS